MPVNAARNRCDENAQYNISFFHTLPPFLLVTALLYPDFLLLASVIFGLGDRFEFMLYSRSLLLLTLKRGALPMLVSFLSSIGSFLRQQFMIYINTSKFLE